MALKQHIVGFFVTFDIEVLVEITLDQIKMGTEVNRTLVTAFGLVCLGRSI